LTQSETEERYASEEHVAAQRAATQKQRAAMQRQRREARRAQKRAAAKKELEPAWAEAAPTPWCQSRLQSAESTASGSATPPALPAACRAEEPLVVEAAEVRIDRRLQAM